MGQLIAVVCRCSAFRWSSFANQVEARQSLRAPSFTTLSGVAAPLDIQNIDTDMIIPKEYLKTIKRTGLGFAAFAELRYENPVEVAAKEVKLQY